MTHDEIIAKAWEHAKDSGLKLEMLHSPVVRDAAVVCFQTQKAHARVEMVLDSQTGEFISATMSDSDVIQNP
jgi:hypothetical protein